MGHMQKQAYQWHFIVRLWPSMRRDFMVQGEHDRESTEDIRGPKGKGPHWGHHKVQRGA